MDYATSTNFLVKAFFSFVSEHYMAERNKTFWHTEKMKQTWYQKFYK